jgi:hypothetical protein
MYIFHPEVGVGKLGVTIETFLADKGSLFGCGSTGNEVNNRAQEKQYSCCKAYTASLGWQHFAFQYEFKHSVALQGHVSRVWREIHSQADMEYWSIGYLRFEIVDLRLRRARTITICNLKSKICNSHHSDIPTFHSSDTPRGLAVRPHGCPILICLARY